MLNFNDPVAQSDGKIKSLSDIGGETPLEVKLIDSDDKIRFGVDSNGNYGYVKAGADTVIPFKKDGKTVGIRPLPVNYAFTLSGNSIGSSLQNGTKCFMFSCPIIENGKRYHLKITSNYNIPNLTIVFYAFVNDSNVYYYLDSTKAGLIVANNVTVNKKIYEIDFTATYSTSQMGIFKSTSFNDHDMLLEITEI